MKDPAGKTGRKSSSKYSSISQNDLPFGRKGKHNFIVHELLNEIAKLAPGQALRIALDDLPDKKANIRSALARASQQERVTVLTSSDDKYFYMWIEPPAGRQGP
jgi:hypothetical protein